MAKSCYVHTVLCVEQLITILCRDGSHKTWRMDDVLVPKQGTMQGEKQPGAGKFQQTGLQDLNQSLRTAQSFAENWGSAKNMRAQLVTVKPLRSGQFQCHHQHLDFGVEILSLVHTVKVEPGQWAFLPLLDMVGPPEALPQPVVVSLGG